MRFAVVGVLLNATLYAAYLVLTRTVLEARPAMTIVYVAGVLIGFLLNRSITFRFRGRFSAAMARYVAAYALGWAVNWVALWVLVDKARVPHELVQLGMIPTLAVLLFVLQRYWVFPTHARASFTAPLRPAA
jgi:putative flippase GtrA